MLKQYNKIEGQCEQKSNTENEKNGIVLKSENDKNIEIELGN